MSEETLDERYLRWLYSQVATVKTRVRARNHWKLIKQLHDTIFVAIVSNDENRIADARDLRYEYLDKYENGHKHLDWLMTPCSMFELLIVLSNAAAFEMDDRVDAWFWHFIDTLGFEQFNDREYDQHPDHVEQAVTTTLDRVIWRTYKPNGQGGLFPLREPNENQREVELWYQLNAYLLEQF